MVLDEKLSSSIYSPAEYQKLLTGKLLLRSEIPLDDTTFQTLVKEQKLHTIPSIINKYAYYKCQRCGNDKPSLFAIFSCYQCKKEHYYCRKCIQMGRVMECEPLYFWSESEAYHWPKHRNACTWEGNLTVAQQRAAFRIVETIKQRDRLLVWAVCGAGKTEMLYLGLTEALKQGLRICIATPRADVVRELKPRIQQAFTNVTVQALYGGSKDKEATAQLILATTHQLLRFKGAFDVMIIDEIDAFPYHADHSLPFATNRAKKSISTTIYLTATPRKQHQIQMRQRKLPHVFVPIRFHGYPLPVPQMKMSFTLRKDLQNNLPPTTFMKWLKKRQNPNRQLLIFVPTISLAERLQVNLMSILLQEKVIATEDELDFVHAEDPARKEKVQQFRNKAIFVMITTTILERGVTFPSIDVAIFDAGHDVFDEAALVQIAGRAGRSPIDPDGEVLFIHDGKTEAMVRAVQAIKTMNKRGGFS